MFEIRRLLSISIAVLHVLITCMLAVSVPASAQSADSDPPVIEFERIEQGVLGDTQVFSATVVDDREVSEVMLHYRFGDQDAYQSIEMIALAGTSIHSASVSTSEESNPVMQYYLEARDSAGNRSIQGFAFDPLERLLFTANDPVASDPMPVPATAPVAAAGMSNGRKVFYGVLGVIAVGALAAAAGGGSDDGGGGNPASDDPGRVPLVITVDPL